MPATTPKGYPYPLGSDRVVDGDDSIRSLAEAVDRKQVIAGTTPLPPVDMDATVSVIVTWPVDAGFTAAPVPGCITSSSRLTPAVSAAGLTNTACTFAIGNHSAGNASSTDMVIYWTATSQDPI